MNDGISESKTVLKELWQSNGDPQVAVDEECSPTKVCRNMRGVSFDAYTEDGTDPREAWRDQLARDGKLDPSAGTLGDLVLGDRPPD